MKELLSEEAKQSIVEKALNRKEESIRIIAAANNVGYSSLRRWLKEYRDLASGESITPSNSSHLLTCKEKLQILLESAHLGEAELGAYCRKHGLYSFQLEEWKTQFMSDTKKTKTEKNTELKVLKAENKRLEKQLQRKDKALAEASALLILKKKANLIWGVGEDD